MSTNFRPDDSQWDAKSTRDHLTLEPHAWKKAPVRNNEPDLDWHPLRATLAFCSEVWKRLEKRWADNPGFVAATAAGSVGLLLLAAMLFNAGIGWLQDDPIPDDVATDSSGGDVSDDPGNSEPDLGEAASDELLFVKGRTKTKNAFQDDDDPGIDTDPFADVDTPGRMLADKTDDNPADDDSDDADEAATVAPIAKPVVKPVTRPLAKLQAPPPRRSSLDDDDDDADSPMPSEPEPKKEAASAPKTDIFEDDDDAKPEEPESKRPLPQMRVASQPQLQPVEVDDEDEVASKEPEPAEEKEPEPAPPEPAKLKPLVPLKVAKTDDDAKPAKPIEDDGEKEEAIPQAPRKIDIVQEPAEKPAPLKGPSWKQQQSKTVAESPAPAVVARQSRPVETRIFAPPPAKIVEPSKTNIEPVQAIQQATKHARAPREKAAAPQLRLAIAGPSAVGIDQPCQVEIRVTNTGATTAQHLVVSAELPDGLVHAVGQSLEQEIESLAPGATYRALLRLRGKALGEKTIQAEVGTSDKATVQKSAKVRITPASETAVIIGSDDCVCEPLVR